MALVVLQTSPPASERRLPHLYLPRKHLPPPPNTQLQSEEETAHRRPSSLLSSFSYLLPMQMLRPGNYYYLSILCSWWEVCLLCQVPQTPKLNSSSWESAERRVLPLVQKSTQAESSAQKGLETESEKSTQPSPKRNTLAKGITEESLEQKEGREGFSCPSSKPQIETVSWLLLWTSSHSSSSSRSRSRLLTVQALSLTPPPRSTHDASGARLKANCRSKVGSRSTSESRSRSLLLVPLVSIKQQQKVSVGDVLFVLHCFQLRAYDFQQE